jgi:alanyl-tRNA synthetase
MAISLATSIATRTIGKKALQKAITTYGKPFIQTLQKISNNPKKIKTTVDRFNKTNKKLEKKTKVEKTKVKKKKVEKEKKAKEKKIEDKKTTTKVKKGTKAIVANTAKDIKDIANFINKVTFGGAGKLTSGAGTLVKGAAKRPVTTGLGLYGGTKAIDMGTKLFQGGNKKETDISNEVTGGGTTTGDKNNTTAQVAGAGGTGVNDFVAAHNSALDGGQQFFRFDGKMYSVGKTRMSDF